MIQKQIIVPKTARYFVQGDFSDNIQDIWFVCHGYGELAYYFSKKFNVLKNENTLIIAPEALNRFYRNGFTGKVGASWMTSEERICEINDYIYYLNSVYKEVISTINNNNVKIHILGFSQGTATVCRWIGNGIVQPNNLILWAGIFPHDIDYAKIQTPFHKTNIQIVMGKTDNYYTAENINNHIQQLQLHGIGCKLTMFDGGHEIHQETLLKLQL